MMPYPSEDWYLLGNFLNGFFVKKEIFNFSAKITIFGTIFKLVKMNFKLIKPSGLDPRIRDVEAFWYKTEIKIIYFVSLCLILRFTLTLNVWYIETKKRSHFFLRLEANFFDTMLSRKAFATNSLKWKFL